MGGRYTEREILHALDKAEADAKAILREEGMPDDWEGGWTPPESLTERTRLAEGARTKIALARASRRRGDADSATKHHNDARDLLGAARLAATREARRIGLQRSAQARREAACKHWSNKFYALAFSAIKAEGKKKRIGGNALNDAAWILARDAGVDARKLDELTPDRARGWIKRNPS
mgnify:CR=1 FL=1